MFDHVSIGVSDLKRAGRFYDAALKPLDCTRLVDGEDALGYGEKGAGLWLLAAKKPVQGRRRVRPAFLLSGQEPGGGRCLLRGGAEGGWQG
jgi:catechol 2,3-dioxygenase-like lactoylglutathione lyase family enzyme